MPPILRRIILVLLWLICLGYAAQRWQHARTEFDDAPTTPEDRRRNDGNRGHALIDFGGQWMTARLLVTGHGRELYHRARQWELAWQAFPPEGESPFNRRNVFPRFLRESAAGKDEIRHDAQWMMYWFMGDDDQAYRRAAALVGLLVSRDMMVSTYGDWLIVLPTVEGEFTPTLREQLAKPAIGGPLYPPVQAFLYAPIGLIDAPRRAYMLFQTLSVGLAFLAGLAITRISQDRIPWSLATLGVLLYPGCRSGLDLGQNHIVTLTILLWGWVAICRGKDVLGGAIWGLFAFKPIWGVTFVVVPFLLRRWRTVLSMGIVGVTLAAVTIPVVGIQAWKDWLKVGQEASELYKVNQNWIQLSRDLSGVVRRVMIDFRIPAEHRNAPVIDRISWAALIAVAGTTIALSLWRGDRRYHTGLGPGFLFLGMYLSGYRFMYYDAMLSLMGITTLVANPAQFLGLDRLRHTVGWRKIFAIRWVPIALIGALYLGENVLLHFGIAMPIEGAEATLGKPFNFEFSIFTPWDTLVLLALWGWCAYSLIRGGDWGEPTQATPRSDRSAAPMSGERMSDSPTRTA